MQTHTAKYFIYTRKSTTQEDRQAMSIPAQREALHRLAEQDRLTIAGIFEERHTAHMPGRPKFSEMMRRIEAGEASGIIAWHPDRLARNSRDGGEIIYFLDAGFLTDLKFSTFWFENTPQGKSNLGHEFVQTKQYSDKLACDTQRGLEKKARMGHFPGPAPRGYLNDKASKTIFPDPHFAPIMKRAFEVYAEGDKTLEFMQNFFAKHGILSATRGKRFKGGRLVHVDWVRRILRNPFYYGHFEYAGELYEGKHKPIISKELFDKVQGVIAERTHSAPEEQKPQALTRLFHCGECGCGVTAEVQKGHVYYRCTKKSKKMKCSQKAYVREEELDRQLTALLLPFNLRSDWAAEWLRMIAEEQREARYSSDSLAAEKQEKLAQIKGALQRLTSAYIVTQDIDRETFVAEKERLLLQKKDIQEVLKKNDVSQLTWFEPFREWIKTAETLGKIADKGSLTDKKAIALKVFGSNLFLDNKKARGSASKPWSFIAAPEFLGEMVLDSCSSSNPFYHERMSVVLEVYPLPQTLPRLGKG
jgi:site-specific DNA recombinase